MNTISRLIHLLNQAKHGDSYHEVARILLKNINRIQDMSIYDIADMCFSSISTISRLSKKLGYKNFSDFRFNLLTAINHYPHINRKMPFIELSEGENYTLQYLKLLHTSLNELSKSINSEYIFKIIAAIHNAKKVSFYSSISHNFASIYTITSFQFDLVMSGKETACFGMLEDQMKDAASLDSDCIAIFVIPNKKDASDLLKVLDKASNKKSKILVVSSGVMSAYKRYADFILSIESIGSSMDDSMLNEIMNILIINYRNVYID